MNLAGVSMTYNDGYKINEWRSHYETYKNQLSYFVIVDNGSGKEYQEKLKATFPEATVILRKTNGGCTAAYNEGIRYILEETDADAIAIIGNDIKLTENCLPRLYDYLMSDEKLGIVSSAVLEIDSFVVDNYGHTVKGMVVSCDNAGEEIFSITEKQKYTDLLTGGFTLAKREFYEKVGLQDEKLFMYCDELDTMFKARKANYKLGVVADEYVWHWHINASNIDHRSSASRYLISRNRVYIAKKYVGIIETIKQFVRGSLLTPASFLLHYIKSKQTYYLSDAKYSLVGAVHGLTEKMYTNKYTKF